MVCEELLQPAVRHRMSEQPFDCRKGACRHIGSRIEALDNMLRMTDRSGQHLRFVTIGAVDLHDVGYQCHAVFGDVVETSPRTETRRSLRPLRRATPVPRRIPACSSSGYPWRQNILRPGFLRPCRAVSRRCGDAAPLAPHPLAPFLRSLWL